MSALSHNSTELQIVERFLKQSMKTVRLCGYPSTYPAISLSYKPIYPSIYLSILSIFHLSYKSIYPSIYLCVDVYLFSICLPLPIYLSTYFSVYILDIPICRSIYLSICLSLHVKKHSNCKRCTLASTVTPPMWSPKAPKPCEPQAQAVSAQGIQPAEWAL